MTGDGTYDLERFVAAQNAVGTYGTVIEELRGGLKRGHWMWFVFPQIAGLGHSATSRRFAISSLEEAKAYLQHPLLGPRLIECTRLVTEIREQEAEQIFGVIDARKFWSSMTLFMRASPAEALFRAVLAQYFDGHVDAATEEHLRSASRARAGVARAQRPGRRAF